MRQGSADHTNLFNHINNLRKSQLKARELNTRKKSREVLSALAYLRNTVPAHGWLECIILGNQPLSFCESEVYWRHFMNASLSRNTSVTYMDKISTCVEKKSRTSYPKLTQLCLTGGAVATRNTCASFSRSRMVKHLVMTALYLLPHRWTMRTAWMRTNI